MTMIKVSNAYKSYFTTSSSFNFVMKNFNMQVQQGTVYSLMGSSGCGKTTLISCLVGIKCLDSGDIEIFGEPPGVNKTRIGYMPQESALVNDFTVREMIWFFGTIYGLSSDKIKERFRFVSDLLELPDEDRLLRDCSGGEKRRVSFALTLVHEPELLILDEPTVGVDPLLRSKIWDYLLELTTTKNVTVVLSTHYIEEAKQSTYVGVMRNGVRLIEDTPRNILQLTETTNLEEAFLKLSENQEGFNRTDFKFQESSEATTQIDSSTKLDQQRFFPRPANKQSFWRIICALMMKHFLRITRNNDLIIISILMPLLGIVSMHFGMSTEPQAYSLGIVNYEVSDPSECFNGSLKTTEIVDDECKLHKLSCRFLDALTDDMTSKKYFQTIDEAFAAAEKFEVIGIIHFAANFTESYQLVIDAMDNNDRSDYGTIHVHLDHTPFPVRALLKKKLLETFNNFSENLLADCGKSRKVGNIPIEFQYEFGNVHFDFRNTFVPGFIIASSFVMTSYLTSVSLISSQNDGTWNRSIAAGVTPNNFLLSHLIEGLILSMIQFAEYSTYSILFLKPSMSLDCRATIILLLLFSGWTGYMYGILCSIFFETIIATIYAGQFFLLPVMFISGTFWPIDATPVLKHVGYLFPFTLPTTAFRNVLAKEKGLSDENVLLAFITLWTWILVQLILCFWLLSRNNISNARNVLLSRQEKTQIVKETLSFESTSVS